MHDESRLNDNYKFKDKLNEQRIKLMISNKSGDKADFQYVTPQQARRKIQKFVKNETICKILVAAIPEDTVTGFQLNNILIEKYSEEQLLTAISNMVKETHDRIKRTQDPRVHRGWRRRRRSEGRNRGKEEEKERPSRLRP